MASRVMPPNTAGVETIVVEFHRGKWTARTYLRGTDRAEYSTSGKISPRHVLRDYDDVIADAIEAANDRQARDLAAYHAKRR